MTDDPYDLQRFVEAQDPVYHRVHAELSAGAKRTHWMWFIFPQIAGLGHSAMAQRYAIASRAEAIAYLAHPLLGPRLRDCTALMLNVADRSARQILGTPDDLKFHSCMTLFAEVTADHVTADKTLFQQALARYFADRPDQATLDRL